MTETEFNPDARDGDGDGIIQEGTEFERPIEEAEVNPVEDIVEDVVEEPVVEPEADPVVEDVVEKVADVVVEEDVNPTAIKSVKKKAKKPALNHSESGALVSDSVEVSAPEATPAPLAEKVALHSTKNVYWEGVGRILRGYNIVSKDAAEKWLQRSHIRLASPEEVKSL